MLRERPELTSGRRAIWWRERAPADHGRRPVSIWLPYRRARRSEGPPCAWPAARAATGWRLLPGSAHGEECLAHAPARGRCRGRASAPAIYARRMCPALRRPRLLSALGRHPRCTSVAPGGRPYRGRGAAVPGGRMTGRSGDSSPATAIGMHGRTAVRWRCRGCASGSAGTLGRRARRRAGPPWRVPLTLSHERDQPSSLSCAGPARSQAWSLPPCWLDHRRAPSSRSSGAVQCRRDRAGCGCVAAGCRARRAPRPSGRGARRFRVGSAERGRHGEASGSRDVNRPLTWASTVARWSMRPWESVPAAPRLSTDFQGHMDHREC